MADGAHDIHTQLDLSGEPLIPDLENTFKLKDPINLLEYQDLTLQGLDYESKYSDYWNATAEEDGKSAPVLQKPKSTFVDIPYCIIGQIIDAVIMPVAPHAAVIPGKYYHTGKSIT